MIPSLLLKLVPYLIVGALAAFLMYRFDSASYEHLQMTFNTYKANEAVAAAEAKDRIDKQHAADVEAVNGVVNDLKAQLDILRGSPVPAAHRPIRLCTYAGTGDISSMPASGTVAGRIESAQPADQGSNTGVRAGDRSGDIGPALRALAEAGSILAIFRTETVKWAIAQGETPK